MVKSDREYRSFDGLKNDDAKTVEGYASTFDTYDLYEIEGTICRERIVPTAFDNADMEDVVFLKDHTGTVFARTRNGAIQLSIDEKGLFSVTDLSRTKAAEEMYDEIKAGNYDRMSFAFQVAKDHFERSEENGKTVLTRVIDEIRKVFDISAVGFPANPNTSIATRSAFDGEIERLEAERLQVEAEKREEARKRLALKLKLEVMNND